jgi:hypothetical protein
VIVYLDMCCLKRPFDDQTQAPIALETTAILAILQAIEDGRLQAIRSLAMIWRTPTIRINGARPSWPSGWANSILSKRHPRLWSIF